MIDLLIKAPIKLSIEFSADEIAALYRIISKEAEDRLQVNKATLLQALIIDQLLSAGKVLLRRLDKISQNRKKQSGIVSLNLLQLVTLHTVLFYHIGPSYEYSFYSALGKIDKQVKEFSNIIELVK